MAERKSILEEALLDVKKIQEALNANTKEILRSVAKEEINGIVKESLEDESDYDEETIGDDEETTEPEGETTEPESEGDEIEIGDENSDDTGAQASDEVGDDQDSEMDMDDMSGEDELDMTGASDDDVIAIYKKLSGEDEIEIVGDEIHMNISEPGEYIVKKGALGGGAVAATTEPEFGDDETLELGDGDEFGGDETTEPEFGGDDTTEPEFGDDETSEPDDDEEAGLTYEIAMDDEDTVTESDEEEDETVTEEESEEDETIEEKIAIGTGMSVGSHRNKTVNSIGGGSNPKIKTESISVKKVLTETEVKYKKLLQESTQLKNQNEEFRQALKKFRGMLIETVVFNSNLTYVTKLFMEHSTTKDEKQSILKRFDEEVANLKESKRLYKTIVTELGTRKPITESVDKKINNLVTTSTSKQLTEATAYVDPSTQRIKDLIKRVENKDKY